MSAFSFNDKYPLRENRGKITHNNYYYLGLKSTTNSIFISNPPKEALKNLYKEDTNANPLPDNQHQQKPSLQPPSKPKLELPALEDVSPKVVEAAGNLKPRTSRKKKGFSGYWYPPTPQDTARDQLLGRRGEDLVFREILKQVKEMGLDESQVVKTYETNLSADHDIKFVNEKGENIWVEVKSTTGRSGRFNWSKAEFEKAVKNVKIMFSGLFMKPIQPRQYLRFMLIQLVIYLKTKCV